MKITKEKISQTAVQLFLDKGYTNVTIQDICNELHITKPTLYKYVNNKEELILDLYDSTLDHLILYYGPSSSKDLLATINQYHQVPANVYCEFKRKSS